MTPAELSTVQLWRLLPRYLGARRVTVRGYVCAVGDDGGTGAAVLAHGDSAMANGARWLYDHSPPVVVARGLYGAAADTAAAAKHAASEGYTDAAALLAEQARRTQAAAVAMISGTAHDAFREFWGTEPKDAAKEGEMLILLAGGAFLLLAGGYLYFLTRAGSQAGVAALGRGTGAAIQGFGEGMGQSAPAAFAAIGKVL